MFELVSATLKAIWLYIHELTPPFPTVREPSEATFRLSPARETNPLSANEARALPDES